MSISQCLDKHELEFVRAFVIRERRERYLSKLSSKKHRRRFLDRLNHKAIEDLDHRFIVESVDEDDLMRQARQSDCRIIADQERFDARTVSYDEAWEALSDAYFGIIVSFIPGKLACYQDEQPSKVVWLCRT